MSPFLFFKEKNMIIDVTGIILTPGNHGKDCLGNGKHYDENGNPLDLCCDECDYLMCCFNDDWEEKCKHCQRSECERNSMQKGWAVGSAFCVFR